MFNLGISEIVLISIIALIFIGPKQLPEIARALGRALNELKRASEDLTSTVINPKNYSQSEPMHTPSTLKPSQVNTPSQVPENQEINNSQNETSYPIEEPHNLHTAASQESVVKKNEGSET